jgi:hypothetical protein
MLVGEGRKVRTWSIIYPSPQYTPLPSVKTTIKTNRKTESIYARSLYMILVWPFNGKTIIV